jgi:lipoate-protein ligase A
MSTSCQLLIDPPADGAWNMAVDEVLLETATAGRCSFRFYRWQQPTLSLGYFQAIEGRRRHAASLGCPVVRRSSGGGAIVHDREVTYSVALPGEHPLAMGRMLLYQAVHQTLIEVLARAGIQAELCRREPQEGAGPCRPFLCFQRRAAGDVVVGTVKVAGSAQRRLQGAVLQHGSVLLGRSAAAPELDGLRELSGEPLRDEPLVEAWAERLRRRLDLAWQRQPLTDEQRAEAADLARRKYAADAWTRWRDGDPNADNSHRETMHPAGPGCVE